MPDLTPFPIDDETTFAYLRQKIPDWHERLRDVENTCKDISDMKEKIDKIYDGLVGTIDKRGYFARVEILEGFKKTMGWGLGVLYVAFVGLIVRVLWK